MVGYGVLVILLQSETLFKGKYRRIGPFKCNALDFEAKMHPTSRAITNHSQNMLSPEEQTRGLLKDGEVLNSAADLTPQFNGERRSNEVLQSGLSRSKDHHDRS